LKGYTLILLTLLLSACSLNSQTDTGAPQVTPSSAPPPSQNEDTTQNGNLTTFTDDLAGFAIDYPADWFTLGGPDETAFAYAITLVSYDPNSVTGTEGVIPGENKIDIYVQPDITDLDTLIQRNKEEVTVLSETLWELGGIPAARLRIIGRFGDEVDILCLILNGRGITIAGFGDPEQFDAVARTIRPLA
jgi:hypothetical protein